MTPDECHGEMFHAFLVHFVLLSAGGGFFRARCSVNRSTLSLSWPGSSSNRTPSTRVLCHREYVGTGCPVSQSGTACNPTFCTCN
jgi:hypothetical protein